MVCPLETYSVVWVPLHMLVILLFGVRSVPSYTSILSILQSALRMSRYRKVIFVFCPSFCGPTSVYVQLTGLRYVDGKVGKVNVTFLLNTMSHLRLPVVWTNLY